MRVLIKRVGEPIKEFEIDSGLDSFQKFVGGYIEPVQITDNVYVICNEEGKLLGMDGNLYMSSKKYGIYDCIVGDVIFARFNDDGEYESLTDEDVNEVRSKISSNLVLSNYGMLPVLKIGG